VQLLATIHPDDPKPSPGFLHGGPSLILTSPHAAEPL
jgi:hypothetical protein